MTHPLANDPTVPAVLRAAFARVVCQIVRSYDDGSDGVINMTSNAKAADELPKHRAFIGHKMRSADKVLVAVEIRAVA